MPVEEIPEGALYRCDVCLKTKKRRPSAAPQFLEEHRNSHFPDRLRLEVALLVVCPECSRELG
jgi:hypothetical protein